MSYYITIDKPAKTSVQSKEKIFTSQEEAKKYVKALGFDFHKLIEQGNISVYEDWETDETYYCVYID